MVFPAIPIAVALFYLGAVPVKLAFRLQAGDGFTFRFGISVFESRFALRRTLSPPKTPPKIPGFLQKLNWKNALKSARRTLRFLIHHTKLEEFSLDGFFGTGDAAVTALVCGGISAIGHTLRGIFGRKISVGLTPDFSGGSLRAELHGMISVRVGHIMLAALLGALEYGSGRLKSWTSTPLKV